MHVVLRLMFGLTLALGAATAEAQQYPSKPIRVIVSIAAGSVTDVIMRAAAAELQTRLGQPLVIENIEIDVLEGPKGDVFDRAPPPELGK